ncbi:ABC transporter ATP-binding protein [Deinococcus cellulosilyticus]|uniref:ABC transporter ATP-binding protein n=1 Tax=Deinococcus cellulosilyticus (strain DSM 18568 / NBRC 106333 / KACC 11606 / 5516J-15) TaxID=1223518 RepID=A0A511N6S2_DEIC1|nr:ABC transporter ATP-binding protein [Deinococcus cellulosilyticus]GEM48146.1 ABC transporter ATP-binding protein [Deinococcus cellulosilyticus NBRC 106333 = KACC 11606]
MLQLSNVNTYYGQIQALKGISLEVNQGEIVALIGGNGAGKTTTLRSISGMVKVKSGDILLEGKKINGISSNDLTARGMAHVPEGRRIFPRLTVLENLEMGAYLVNDKKLIAQRMQRGFEFFPRLAERKNQLGGTLSGGEQQMLAVARALMIEPKLLLLDEPSMGLSPLFVEAIFDIIVKLKQELKTTILLVEQNASMALDIADRAYVLRTGEIILAGKAADIANNDSVKEAYLGEA